MKLWVDDIRNAPDETWHIARTVTAAIRALAQYDFEEISLDHDISHQVVLSTLSRPYPCEETFEGVAHYIASKYSHTFAEPKITIHSSNPVGSDRMKAILKAAGFEATLTPSHLANRLEMEV